MRGKEVSEGGVLLARRAALADEKTLAPWDDRVWSLGLERLEERAKKCYAEWG